MGSSRENTLYHNVFRTESSFSEAFCKRGGSLIAEGFQSDRTILIKLGEIVIKLTLGVALIGIGFATAPVGSLIHLGIIFGGARGATRDYNHLPAEGRRLRYRNGRLE